jgi:plasmid stabilization system protein ParE
MADITWTEQALADVEAVCLYIARDAPRYTELFARRVFQTTDRLAAFPRLGRVVPEIGLTTFARCLCRVTGSSIDCS